jgi:uncharacterized phage-associated protein
MTTWKLQKLVYYCQAWSLVWDDDQLFPEEIEAWANGPVVRDLYREHRGQFRVSCQQLLPKGADPDRLSEEQRDTVDVVLNEYGERSPQWLSDLTHMEDPWLNARKGLTKGARARAIIPKADLAEYYGSLLPGE